jgi:hypothetical protein
VVYVKDATRPAELGGWVRAGLPINENMPD